MKKVAERVREDVDYYRAVEKARRKGDMLPIRKQGFGWLVTGWA